VRRGKLGKKRYFDRQKREGNIVEMIHNLK